MRFDKRAGLLTEYRYKGMAVLERGPLPDFWRAPTNNDRGACTRGEFSYRTAGVLRGMPGVFPV